MPDETVLRAKAREVIRTGKLRSRRPDQPTRGVRPMELQVGTASRRDREWEVVGRPFTTAGGKNAHHPRAESEPARAYRFADVGAHERIAVKRTGAEGPDALGWPRVPHGPSVADGI
jgi:hypothetical protein